MELFGLPQRTRVDRVIPKNAFDVYASSKQKKLFTNRIARITWLHKISPDTVNLKAGEIKEIQIFKAELKGKEEIQMLLDVIDKAIPYSIIFIVECENEMYLSASAKHPHPVNEDNAVIDWRFNSMWFSSEEKRYSLQLKKSLDAVYHDFCIQLCGKPEMGNLSLYNLAQYKKRQDVLETEIAKLERNIKDCKQYKIKVGLNLELRQKLKELKQSNS